MVYNDWNMEWKQFKNKGNNNKQFGFAKECEGLDRNFWESVIFHLRENSTFMEEINTIRYEEVKNLNFEPKNIRGFIKHVRLWYRYAVVYEHLE